MEQNITKIKRQVREQIARTHLMSELRQTCFPLCFLFTHKEEMVGNDVASNLQNRDLSIPYGKIRHLFTIMIILIFNKHLHWLYTY